MCYLWNAVLEYLEFMYLGELEIKETSDTITSSSYLDLYLYIDNGKPTSRLYDNYNDFKNSVVNFTFLSSTILSAPAHGVNVSHLS